MSEEKGYARRSRVSKPGHRSDRNNPKGRSHAPAQTTMSGTTAQDLSGRGFVSAVSPRTGGFASARDPGVSPFVSASITRMSSFAAAAPTARMMQDEPDTKRILFVSMDYGTKTSSVAYRVATPGDTPDPNTIW